MLGFSHILYMVNYKITSVRVGFGVTILPSTPSGNVLKYYLEPEIQLEIPASAENNEELQLRIDEIGNEVFSMVQKTVKAKALSDKKKKEEQNEQTRQ